MNILDIAPERFAAIYSSLDPVEQGTLTQILQEFSETGESETYNTVWLQDYEEIPVDIDTFLENDEYLGKATNHGTQIYPFWRNALREIFANGDTAFHEVVFSGAIGIGKTAIAVYAISYLLYRLLCLKRPQRYFGFADSDDIAIFFFNATVALAEGVGYKRLHACCLQSPWFMAHGKKLGSSSNPYYAPDKHIVIRAGSKGQHGLGQQIFCVVGSTKVVTDCGVIPIEKLEGMDVNVLQKTDDGLVFTKAPVIKTKYTQDTIRITLDNGAVIEGTPEHKVMLTDGTYKALGDLTENDELYSDAIDPETLKTDTDQYSVYMHILPNGKRYIGQCLNPENRWVSKGAQYHKNKPFFADIKKFGWDNIEHIIIKDGLNKYEALQLEADLIHEYDTTNADKGYNHCNSRKYKGEVSESYRQKLVQRQADKGIFQHSCWVSKDDEALLVRKDQVDEYIQKGYHRGRDGDKVVYVAKGDHMKRIPTSELDAYIEEGWTPGWTDAYKEAQRKRFQRYIWICDDIEFNNATELTKYLRATHYPTIYISTITGAFNGNPCIKYPDLLDRVKRIEVKH